MRALRHCSSRGAPRGPARKPCKSKRKRPAGRKRPDTSRFQRRQRLTGYSTLEGSAERSEVCSKSEQCPRRLTVPRSRWGSHDLSEHLGTAPVWAPRRAGHQTWQIKAKSAPPAALGRLLSSEANRAPRAGGYFICTPGGARLHLSADGPCTNASSLGVSVRVRGALTEM